MIQPEIRRERSLNEDALIYALRVPALTMMCVKWPRAYLAWQLARLFYVAWRQPEPQPKP